MIEKTLLQLVIMSLYVNVVFAFITIVLLIILTNFIIKNNHISADQ